MGEPHGPDFDGDPVYQIVVPSKCRSLVLLVSHVTFFLALSKERSSHRTLKLVIRVSCPENVIRA